MVKKVYSVSLDERLYNSIPWQNKSSFISVALCKTMIDFIDAKESIEKADKKNILQLIAEGSLHQIHLRKE